MANTVSSLSYANTFGDWMVTTNNLVVENNILAKENYVKDSGTLFLSESSQTALQSNGNVIIQKVFSVVGIGSSATIQNNLDVQGQGYFSNAYLSLATTGSANVGNVLHVLGSGTALRVANNSQFNGNISVVSGTFTETLQSNNSVNTSNASIYNTVYTNKVQANTNIVTGTLTANNKVFTNDVQANTSILTSTIQANTHVTTTSVGVSGTAWVNVLQANTSTNTSNASVIHTLYANVVQANVSTNTSTASVTGTTFTDVLQANTSTNTRTLSVTGVTHTDVLQANSSSNTANASVYWTLYANVVQANVSTNTTTASVTGTTFTDVLQANTSANTRTLSVTGVTHTDVLQANTSTNTRTMSVTGVTHTDVLQANTSANTRTLSVTGNTFTDVLQANTSANTRTLSVTGTTFTDVLIANNRVNTINVWSTHTVTANTIRANTDVYTPNVRVSQLIDAENAEARVYNLQVGVGGLSIEGNFTLNGRTVFNSNEFIISQGTPNQTSKFSTFRTTNGLTNGVAANASIRWNETDNYFDLNDVDTGTYYRIITEQQLSDSTVTVDGSRAASLTAANTLNNAIQTANTFLRSRSDSSSVYANGAFAASNSASSYANGAFGAANSASLYANGAFTAANNVGPQIVPAFNQANSAFAKANAATAEIKGTRGSISPTLASLTFTSNNGLEIHATSANTLAISTSQNLQAAANPTFAGLTLSTTQLPPTSGGTGTSSLSSAFNNMIFAATGGYGASGNVLATNGSGNYYWTAQSGGGGGGATPGTVIVSSRLTYTGDGTTTLWDTPTFSQANQVRVYINGVRQADSEYSLNSNTSKLTFNTGSAPVSGDKFFIEVDGYTTYAYNAGNLSYSPTGTLSAVTIQTAIDAVESAKMPKLGGTFTGHVVGLTIDKSVANTSFATGTYVHNLANSNYTFSHSITGNAGTVTNGLYSTESYANPTFITSLSADKLSGGTIGSTILGNSNLYIGTTQIALNRASAGSHTLNGVSVSGDAGTVGGLAVHTGVNNENNKVVRTDATGNTIVKTLITSDHQKIQATPLYVMSSNSTGTTANVTSYQTAYLRVSYADTAGSASASDVYTWAKAATKPSYTKAEVGLGSVDNTADSVKTVASAGNATTAGGLNVHGSRNNEANKIVRTDASGYIQAGYINSSSGNEGNNSSPARVWGAASDTDHYLRTYLTSALSVSYAATAGSAPASGGTSSYVTINYNNNSDSTYQVLWGSGTAVYGTAGIYVNPFTDSLFTTGNITAYASDKRLKGNIKTIQNALYKVCQISGVTYDWNKNTKDLGFKPTLESETGVLAQEIEKVIPDAVTLAPFDRDEKGNSKSGENYLTVHYEKIIPLLIEAIKELKAEVETLKGQIK